MPSLDDRLSTTHTAEGKRPYVGKHVCLLLSTHSPPSTVYQSEQGLALLNRKTKTTVAETKELFPLRTYPQDKRNLK